MGSHKKYKHSDFKDKSHESKYKKCDSDENLISEGDITSANIKFEEEGFDLETGLVKIPEFPGDFFIPGSDFTFAYNGNNPTEQVNAVLFQNQGSENPVEIAFIDETSLFELTQQDVDQASFSTTLIDQLFESDDTILLKTQEGNVFAIGNASENDAFGEDFSVDFDFSQIDWAPPAGLISANDITSANIKFEEEGFDLETGLVKTPEFPGDFFIPGSDFTFAYNGNNPTEQVNAVLFQNQGSENPVEIAFIDETSLFELTQQDVDQASFSTALIDQLFESDDTILLKTQEGNVFALGNTSENDASGEDFSVDFDFANLTGLFI